MGRAVLIAALWLAGCRFDSSGLAPDPLSTAKPDTALADLAAYDGTLEAPPPSDLPRPWDLPFVPDTDGSRPLTESHLGQVFNAATVPCVDASGQDKGYSIPIVDSAALTFVDAATVTLPGAPKDTLSWVGSLPAVTVIYDLNACDNEYPGRASWGSAGLLVRKATLDPLGRLVLQPDATVYDIDLIDVLNGGAYQGTEDFALPDDSRLAVDHKQLVNPVGKAKALIIQEGLP